MADEQPKATLKPGDPGISEDEDRAEIFVPGKGGYAFAGKGGRSDGSRRAVPDVPKPKKPDTGAMSLANQHGPDTPKASPVEMDWSSQTAKPVSQPASAPKPAAKPEPKAAAAPVPAPKPKPTPAPAPAPQAAAPKAAPKPAPKPAVSDKPKAKTPVKAKDQGRVIATSVVNSFVGRMTKEAEKKGGSLSIADIQAMQAEFAKQTDALTNLLEHSFDAYAKQMERKNLERERAAAFERVMVQQFEHLLINDADIASAGRGTLARRMVGPFNEALRMMMGPDEFERMEERCRAIVDRVKDTLQDGFDWNLVYDDPGARSVVLDGLMTIAGYFEQTERRVTWLVGFIDSRIDETKDSDANWVFDDAAARALLKALFSALHEALRDTDGRDMLSGRFGAERVAIARRVVKVFH